MLPKWIFLFVICVLPVLGLQDPRTQSLLDTLKERRNNFKLRLHKIFEEGKNGKDLVDGKKLVLSVYSQLLLNGSAEVTTGCTAGAEDSDTVFVLTSKNELFMIQNITLMRVRGFRSSLAFLNLQALQYRSIVLLIAQHASRGRSYIDIHEIEILLSRKTQRIQLGSDALVSAMKFKQEFLYIAIVENNRNVSDIRLYRKMLVGAKKMDEIFSTGIETDCSGLAIWTVDRDIYIALSYAGRGKLEIKQFLESSRRMSPIQSLNISTHIIKTYANGGNLYLVCGTEGSIVIFWWTGSVFELLHSIFLQSQIVDIVIYKDSNRPLIAVVTQHEVEFLVKDSSAQFAVSGRQKFDPSESLRTVLLWKSGASIYMLPLFDKKSLVSMYEISLEFDLSDAAKEMSFNECVTELHNRINEREEVLKNLSSAVELVWSSSTTYRFSSMKVKGTIKSLTSSVVISLNQSTGVSSLVDLRRMHIDLLNVTLGWQSEFSKLLLKSASQTIKSNLQFMNVSVRQAKFDKLLKHLNINDVATDRLYHSTLKNQGDQVLTRKITVENAFCKTASTTFFNRNKMQDYVLLSPGYCFVTGHVTFKGIATQSVYVRNTINNIAIEDMVLTTKPQEIWGQKTFESLTAESIQTTSKSGIQDLLSEIEKFSLRDEKVNFISTLNIEGNLDISYLDGRDLSFMFSSMVKRNQRGYIRGIKTFKSLEVRGDMKIDGEINGVSLVNFMTINSNQSVTGNVTFSTIELYKDVLTDLLNGYDLSSAAVVKSSLDLEIKGVKSFDNDLKVSNIDMKNLIVIDCFDPSVEFSDTFDVEDITNSKSIPWIVKTPVTIGNIKANSINVGRSNLPYLQELSNVWLKTTEQTITRLNAERIKFKNLNVSKLNGINITDLVTVNEHDYIDVNITFAEDIFTRALKLEKEVDLNIPPEFWNPDIQVKIEGSVHMEHAIVKGNLNIGGAIKNLDFMHAKENQTVEGKFDFSSIYLKDLMLQEAEFDYLNEIDIQKYFESSVLLFNVSNIYNKAFLTLEGRELNCSGTLNNVMIDKVATTDTNQKLKSSYRFPNKTSFNKSVKVKKFFGDIGLESVICVDRKETVSNKYFSGTVITSDVSAKGTVSGINVTSLHLAAFSKSRKNFVAKKITFHGNVSAGEINVAANKSVDGVTLDNLIRLDESMELGDLKTSSVTAKNVRVVGGKVNGCDLKSVSDDALWLERDSQYILNRVHVKKLKIDGDLEIELWNGAYIPDLISYLQNASTFKKEKNVIFENVKTENITVAGTVNDISVGFVFQDYVQKNKPQVISGKKSFEHIKGRTIMAASLQSNKTCGIDVSEMYRLSVTKSNSKSLLLGDATFPGLNATRITVKGKVNGLMLPEDVVLTYSDETIEEKVVILNLLKAPAGLKVLGTIDGIQLESFIDKRVSLSGNESIRSEIILEKNSVIEGDCSIKVINGIIFDTIVNGVQKQVITGSKKFTGFDLIVTSNVKVNGVINHINIQDFLSSLVRSSANESLEGVVNFSNITVPSLVCYTINGFNVGDVYNNTDLLYHYKSEKLDNFTADFKSHRKLMHKLDPVENSLLLYKWFELHKILDYGSVERFLPVYEYGTHGPKYELETVQMVMWVKRGRTGRRSIVADVMKDGTIVKTKQIDGKVFPFFCSVQEDDAVGFYVQETDATSANSDLEVKADCSAKEFGQDYFCFFEIPRCTGKECIVIMTLYTSGEWKNTKIPSSGSGSILDVQLFEVEEMIFVILSFSNAGSSEKIVVYRYETDNSTWVRHQKFHMQDMTSLSILEAELDETSLFDVPSLYLAVTGDKTCPGVTIYEWDSEEFIHVSNISTSVSTYATWVYNDRALYLLLAKEKDVIRKENNVSVNTFNEPLEVYTIEDELLLNHTVNVKGVSFLETFGFRDETFVLATSKRFGTVYVLQFRGYNGLELVQEIPSPGVTETRVFTVGNHLYLALNSMDSRVSSNSHRARPSRILVASARGRIQEDSGQQKDSIKLFV